MMRDVRPAVMHRPLLILLLLLGPATAQGGEGAENPEQEAARALTLYRAERYVEAARHFLRAYELSHNPTQLHNAAKALEKGEFLSQALVQWERYAEIDSISAEKRALANARIDAIRRTLDARRKARDRIAEEEAQAPPPPNVVQKEPPESNAVARYTVAGIGGAALLCGAGLYLSGWVTYWKFDDTKDERPEVTRSQANAAKLRSGIGIGIAAAGALTVAGAFIFMQDPPQVALFPSPGGVALAGAF